MSADLDELDRRYAELGEWRVGSPRFGCNDPSHKPMRHPGPPRCTYEFCGWVGDDDDPGERYFSRFVSQVQPPREVVGSDEGGPLLTHADAVAMVAIHNAYPGMARELRAAREFIAAVREDDNTAAVRVALANHDADVKGDA